MTKKKSRRLKLTLAAKQSRKVPQLSHVEGLKDLTLVAGTVTVQNDTGVLAAGVLVGKSQASADRDLGADNTVATVKVLGEHVHRTALSVGDTLTAAEKLADDGSDGAATHHGETVASVGGDDVVLLGDGMLDTDSNGLLAGRQVAETADLLLLVQAIGSHLHLSERLLVLSTAGGSEGASCCIPDGDHLVVHLLQLLLGHLNRVRRRVQLVGLEALVAEGNLEGLIIGLYRMAVSRRFTQHFPQPLACKMISSNPIHRIAAHSTRAKKKAH